MLPDRYAEVRRIGHGGMGDIFRAEDTALGRTVAVKVLADRYAADESVRARFTREALAAARLSASPNAVTIFDVGEHEGHPYIVMEYLGGGTIAEKLVSEGTPTPARALAWLEDAGRALDAAHAQGVVHRDVKPANLLLDDQGDLKVADFGIASATGLDSLTQAGTVLGTAGYLAPEQARGEQTTAASDRYALGVVAYELLSGRRPFERESPTAEAAAHANDEPPAISSVQPALPAAVDRVFEQALAKDPADRYDSCGELVDALRRALREGTAETRIVAAPPTRTTAVAAGTRPATGRRAHRTGPSWPFVAALAALLIAGGIGLAAVLAAGGDDTPEARTIARTITSRGQTVTVTTTTKSEPPPTTRSTEATTTAAQPSGSASSLNDEGYRKLQAGDAAGALPLLERAVVLAQGTGTLTEAYADYNLALARFQTGTCDGVAALLDRSQQVQGRRKEIDQLRRQVEKGCD